MHIKNHEKEMHVQKQCVVMVWCFYLNQVCDLVLNQMCRGRGCKGKKEVEKKEWI